MHQLPIDPDFLKNFAEETKEALTKYGKTFYDIQWIGCGEYSIPQEEFWGLADFVYNSGYGSQNIAPDLVIMFRDGTWLYRKEYDGSECWGLVKTPRKPTKKRSDIFSLFFNEKDCRIQ